ncbi:cell surface glycoprotein 1-like [Acipenser oxyrinchus oxyrinchus]|uniref:Cell surface glycoprotein 1-like n=1 Tax=Acipenser oxyrinchus oxyrinchus TaxID=40147 RepID=A0AAD8D3U7_ACIOX|nr:cell surface glycoprotein 1-like [Acipenser oxyrinchus oxyrinchus]
MAFSPPYLFFFLVICIGITSRGGSSGFADGTTIADPSTKTSFEKPAAMKTNDKIFINKRKLQTGAGQYEELLKDIVAHLEGIIGEPPQIPPVPRNTDSKFLILEMILKELNNHCKITAGKLKEKEVDKRNFERVLASVLEELEGWSSGSIYCFKGERDAGNKTEPTHTNVSSGSEESESSETTPLSPELISLENSAREAVDDIIKDDEDTEEVRTEEAEPVSINVHAGMRKTQMSLQEETAQKVDIPPLLPNQEPVETTEESTTSQVTESTEPSVTAQISANITGYPLLRAQPNMEEMDIEGIPVHMEEEEGDVKLTALEWLVENVFIVLGVVLLVFLLVLGFLSFSICTLTDKKDSASRLSEILVIKNEGDDRVDRKYVMRRIGKQRGASAALEQREKQDRSLAHPRPIPGGQLPSDRASASSTIYSDPNSRASSRQVASDGEQQSTSRIWFTETDLPSNMSPESWAAETDLASNMSPESWAAETDLPSNMSPESWAAETDLPSNVPPESEVTETDLPSDMPPESGVTETDLPSEVPQESGVTETDLPSEVPQESGATETDLPSDMPPESGVTETDLPSDMPPESGATETDLPSDMPPESGATETDLPSDMPPESGATETDLPSNMPQESGVTETDLPSDMPPESEATETDLPSDMPPESEATETDLPSNMPPEREATETDLPSNMPPESGATETDLPSDMPPESEATETDLPSNMPPESGVTETDLPSDMPPESEATETDLPSDMPPEREATETDIPSDMPPESEATETDLPSDMPPEREATETDLPSDMPPESEATETDLPSDMPPEN